MTPRNTDRCLKLIHQSLCTFGLDLEGLTVLTEAASGYYMLTPFIAALAGAARVYLIAKDSRFGRADDVLRHTLSLAAEWNVDRKLSVFHKNDKQVWDQLDIVTNLGFVRPIDRSFVQNLNRRAVIPLMWETWEYRPEDLDLEACRAKGICVLGTNEDIPELRTHEYVGKIAVKLLYSEDIEILGCRILVIGNGSFGYRVKHALEKAGAAVNLYGSRKLAGRERLYAQLERADAIVIAEHEDRRMLVGNGGMLTAREIKEINPAIVVAHICGNIDIESIRCAGIRCVPDPIAKVGYMSKTTDYLGPKPLIDLHAAGLSVGQHLAQARKSGCEPFEAESHVLRTIRWAQGFPGYHLKREKAA